MEEEMSLEIKRFNESLPEEDVKLTQEIRDVDKRYKDLYTHVHKLAVTYQACKNHFVLRSYGELKRMIKACTTDEVMQCVAQCRADQEAEQKGEAVSSAATETTARTKLSDLQKAEIVINVENKRKKKRKLYEKNLRLYDRLEKLQRSYRESKQHFPVKRYREMKEMIKPLTKDDSLKPDL